jgi:hypothetical protein
MLINDKLVGISSKSLITEDDLIVIFLVVV